MNTTANKNVNKTNAISNRACLLSFIPKRNAEHIDLSEVLECMSRFHSENKKLEIVYDLNRERSILKTLYQDKAPNRLDVTKVIEKLRSMDCGVLIIPTFRTVADKPEICSDILMALHEANIRIISPYDEFDSKEIYDQATAETAELFNDLRKALRQTISKCVVKNVDEFIGYVELTKTHHKNSPFVLAYGNKAIQIPYSDDICEEIFDFLDMLDAEYLRPELFTDVESDDDDDDEDEAPPMCMAYDEPLVERDFEG